MRSISCLLALVGLVGITLAAAGDETEEAVWCKWRHVFDGVAAEYKLAWPSEKKNRS